MQIEVNGDRLSCTKGMTVEDLLMKLGMQPNAILVERNGDFVRRPEYPRTVLEDGDLLELIKFVGGG